MTSTRKWALALLSALCFSGYSKAQDVTGNLSNPYSWQGAGQIGVPITCMAPGQPGYCGPHPSVGGLGDINSINFSYGLSNLYQDVNITGALPYSGTGLIVTGFNFGFSAKNGNGWDDGATDRLTPYVNIYGPGGSVKESYNYNLNYTFNWTAFNYNETFANPYRTNQITTARFGFLGQDLNGWAGFYGPEVTNVTFSLKYAPDPCVTNPLSSPSCPGFSSALATRTTPPATTTTEVAVAAPLAATTTTAPPPATTATPVSSATRATAAAPRLENIIRAVNSSTAATVQATVQQSQEQAQAQEQAAAQQAENQSQQSQQITALPPGTSRVGGYDATSDAGPGAFTRPGDPAAAARGGLTAAMSEPPAESRPQPRSVQPPAELAGGPSVVAFQTSVDITAYTNVVMRDAAFYAPREIYRGQQTVDNMRALRGLGSDRRHQEMIDQQWRR
jgi:hypothetical protein